MKMQTTCKLMTLIKKVMQLKDDQYIEDLTFQVMEEIDKQNEPGWRARYENKWSNKNNTHIKQAVQDARFFNWNSCQRMQDRRQA